MGLATEMVIAAGIKILIVLLVIIVLILTDPTYVTAYISINYEIVIIYIFSALTLLYCITSVVLYCVLNRRDEAGLSTNHSMAEVIFATAGIMGWLIVIGIGGTISQRTIIETGEVFGWIGALAGIITACFLVIAAIFALNVVQEKLLNEQRQHKYAVGPSRASHAGLHGGANEYGYNGGSQRGGSVMYH